MMHARAIIGVRGKGMVASTLPGLHNNSSNLSRHDLGADVTCEALEAEANAAIQVHNQAVKALLSGDLHRAMNDFFKSAAIAVNVVFTARTHAVAVPPELMSTMDALCSQATHGIKRVMKMIAMKKIVEHTELLHPAKGMGDAIRTQGERTAPQELHQAFLELRDARTFLESAKRSGQERKTFGPLPMAPAIPPSLTASWAEQRAMQSAMSATKAKTDDPTIAKEADWVINKAQTIIGEAQLLLQHPPAFWIASLGSIS